MATLVQFLASGVNGAESGTATFLLRGTVSSAAAFLYSDFEQTAQPGTNVIVLDANGAAEVYTSAYVDCVIRNSAGTTLRTVTLGNSAPVVEVESTSFTGTDYDGAPANTIGEPITLKAVLDKWILSAGAADWQVDVDGNPTNLSTAFSSIAGLFINVKDPQYGAVGDGVTNDTVAVTNAFAAADAAGGGTVIFPPGRYLMAGMNVDAVSIAIVGFGQAAIVFSSGNGWTFTDNTLEGQKAIQGLRFETSASATRVLTLTAGNQNLSITGCVFVGDGLTDNFIEFGGDGGFYNIRECRFLPAITQVGGAILEHTSGDGKTVNVISCSFELPLDFVNIVLGGSCFRITDTLFDGDAVTTAAFTMLDAGDPVDADFYYGLVKGCEFTSGGASVNVFRLGNVGPDSYFVESDNTFFGATAPYAHTNNASLGSDATVHYGSRKGRQFSFDNAVFPTLSTSAPLPYDKFVVNHTAASNFTLTFTGTNRPVGLEWDAVVLNNSGGPVDVTFAGTGQSTTVAAVADGGRALAHYFTYLETTGTVCVGITGTGIAAT